jgi:perosamine synthetase
MAVVQKKYKMIALSEPVIGGNALKYVSECLNTGWVSSAGKFVDKFEEKTCEYTGAKHAIACVNGTAGLQLALRICGVGPHDEVIVPTVTFIATANAARYLYAQPVFMDCDDYMNIDCKKLREFCSEECRVTKQGLKNKRTGRIIKAVVPVHLYGRPCDMEEVMKIARKYRLKVVEDAAESLGASYTAGHYEGRMTGTIGDLGVYSFNGNKIITTGGGGMIVTNDASMAQKANYLVNQAKDDPVRYVHNEIGYNFRLTNIQAALGVSQLECLKGFIKTKKSNYGSYKKLLGGIAGVSILDNPPGTAPNYWFYLLMIDKDSFGADREQTMEYLCLNGVQTRPIWHPIHIERPYMKNQAYRIEKAMRFWNGVLCLPCSSNLKPEQVKYVVSAIMDLGKRGR